VISNGISGRNRAECIHQCKEVTGKVYGESCRKELEVGGVYMRRNAWAP